jgi:hypothetical protein
LRWLVALAVASVASVLLWLGAPRFLASILKAPAHATVIEIDAGRTPPAEQLGRAAGYLENARTWEASADLGAELGFVRLLQAVQADPAARAPMARLAVDSLRESLRRAPSRPHPWVRLAYARDLEDGTSEEVVRLLERSTRVGPFVGEVALVRLTKLLKYWDRLTPALRLYSFRQIKYMWANNQGFVIQAARQSAKPHIIRFALRAVPGALDDFDRAVPAPSN